MSDVRTCDDWRDLFQQRLRRKSELLRGRYWRWRGVSAGARFGLGRGVRIFYPRCLTVGDDVSIEDYAYLHCLSERGVRIGSHTSFGRNLWLHCGGAPGDCAHGWFEIGERSYVGCNAVLGAGGGITIGDNVLIGQSVNIHAENHRYRDPRLLIRDQGVDYLPVTIGDDVWIGSKATILGGVTIGRGAVVGAGAVVTADVPSYSVVAGVPARVIGLRERGDDAPGDLS